MKRKKVIWISIIILLIIILVLLISIIMNKNISKKALEDTYLNFASNNSRTIFAINKIVFFSNSNAKNKNIASSNFTIENLYQYTDMAIFINNNEEKTLENTFKEVYINNIHFTKLPEIGEPKLYYKNINNFAKSEISNEHLISDKLDFNIVSDDYANLDTPTLYNNLANPITLSYINSNIKTDYTITDTSNPITYDGSLLKRCNVSLSQITCSLSFDIYITNNLNQKFKCSVFIDIPLETPEHTIYDGNITLKKDTDYIFYRFQ